MKRALLCGLSAALLLALVLVACNKPQADQPTEPDPTPPAVQTQPAETPETEETNEPVNQVEKMSVNTTQEETDTPREATLMDLLELFQAVYDCRADWISLGETEEILEVLELEEVNFQVEVRSDVIFPADIQNQYLTWKAIYYGTTEPVSAEEQQQTTSTAENTTTTTTQTGGSGTGGTTQTGTNTQQGSLVQQPTGGGLAVDVTGGKSPMDYMILDREDIVKGQEEINNSGAFLDMSKVGFGN